VAEREHVTGAQQVRRRGGRVDKLGDRSGAAGGGDTGADPVLCVHADGERGAVLLAVVRGHLGEVEPVEFGRAQRTAEYAQGVLGLSVSGIRQTSNHPSGASGGVSAETVRLIPSTAIEPFSTTYRAIPSGRVMRTWSQCSAGVLEMIVAVASTCPCTR